jgi:single-strand DNA-binding protein
LEPSKVDGGNHTNPEGEEGNMSAMNRVFLMGNLTRDPELRQIPSGKKVCEMGLAVGERYRNAAGETVETTCFVDLVAWDKQAEACAQYLKKGRPVLVEGRLQQDRWETDKGEKRNRMRVRADRVHFLNGSKGNGVPAAAGENGGTAEDEGPAEPF